MSDRVALYIDADNISAKHADTIMAEAAKHGDIVIRRAYGNYTVFSAKSSWKEAVRKYAIEHFSSINPVEHTKNCADMALTVDALEAFFCNWADVFCIVSSDTDFIPLAQRIRRGKAVYGFGDDKSPAGYQNAFTEFILLKTTAQEDNTTVKTDGTKPTMPSPAAPNATKPPTVTTTSKQSSTQPAVKKATKPPTATTTSTPSSTKPAVKKATKPPTATTQPITLPNKSKPAAAASPSPTTSKKTGKTATPDTEEKDSLTPAEALIVAFSLASNKKKSCPKTMLGDALKTKIQIQFYIQGYQDNTKNLLSKLLKREDCDGLLSQSIENKIAVMHLTQKGSSMSNTSRVTKAINKLR